MTYDVFSKRTDPVFTKFEVQPAAGCIGAYISGIDLSEPLDEVTVAELTDAWVHYHVLFFRGQSLTTEQHVAFARY